MPKLVGIYIIVFLTLTATDIASTIWGISSQNGHEFNSAVASAAGGLHLQRMLVINGVFLVFSAGMLHWALRNRDVVDRRYLTRPELGMFSWLHVNPFSAKTMPKSVFSYIVLAPAILGFKALVSINNCLIAAGLPDLVTPIARLVHEVTVGPFAYWMVIFVVGLPIQWVSVHLAARFLSSTNVCVETPVAASP